MKRARKFTSDNVHSRVPCARRLLSELPLELVDLIARSECKQMAGGVRFIIPEPIAEIILALESELARKGRSGCESATLRISAGQERFEILSSYVLAARDVVGEGRGDGESEVYPTR